MPQSCTSLPYFNACRHRGPLTKFETRLLERRTEIEDWFAQYTQKLRPPLTCSVDLRHAGFKLAPIDTNLFPAGFNNLDPAAHTHAADTFKRALDAMDPKPQHILLIPEMHTRNMAYLRNLQILISLLDNHKCVVSLGHLQADNPESVILTPETGEPMTLQPLQRDGDQLRVDGVCPDLVLLNNDLSAGVPDILKGLAQPIRPTAEVGWATRLKSQHFAQYRTIADEFGQLVDLDPWLFNALFRNCGNIDFMAREGMDCVVRNTRALLTQTQEKYDQHGIDQKPYVIVKADSGTYGMAIMVIEDAQQLLELNRKQRTKMSASKGGQSVTKVIVQEGVPTADTLETPDGAATAEPVIYTLGGEVVGGFYRAHFAKDALSNLNAPGMQFVSMKMSTSDVCNETACAYYPLSVVARMAMLAAAKEIDIHR